VQPRAKPCHASASASAIFNSLLDGETSLASSNDIEDATDAGQTSQIAEQARMVAPVVWLIGKVQAGKSSLIQTLTGADGVAIGQGICACTQTSTLYAVPPDAPLIQFLDTRGLGEAGYDPQEDMAVARGQAHCVIAVMRAMDRQQSMIVDALKTVRKRHPSWPVLIVQTRLHEAYGAGEPHPQPYPFVTQPGAYAVDQLHLEAVPPALVESLEAQRALFDKLPGDGPLAFVPVDFTQPIDGMTPLDYGHTVLQQKLVEIAPLPLSTALREIRTAQSDASSLRSMILGHAAAASAADLVPIAAAAAVPAVQAKLLHAMATRYGVRWDRRTMAEFSGALGIGLVARYASGFGIRQLAKLIPAYGQTVGAVAASATSFATTYAMGQAADYFLSRKARGEDSDQAGVRSAWQSALAEALQMARNQGLDPQPDPANESSARPLAARSTQASPKRPRT